jgi:hypothetical protein
VLHRSLRRGRLAVVLTTLMFAGSGAAAEAATVTATGDDGNPVTLTQGAPASLRNMDVSVGVAFPPENSRFNLTITGPDGVAVTSPISCYTSMPINRSIDYRGNGAYTITVTNFAYGDRSCATPTSTETYSYVVGGGVTLGAPAIPFLIRQPNSYMTNELALPVALNPGASSYEVRYALGGVVGPDGAISGPSDEAFVNRTTGTAGLRFKVPGTYTAVARASAFGGSAKFFTPWSAPVRIRAIVPFDLERVSFPDSRGPSYTVRGYLREKAIRGKVRVYMARGKKGGKYKLLGSAKISRKGTFTKRFRQHRTGYYRMRFTYKGSSIAAGGKIVGIVRITKRLYYR